MLAQSPAREAPTAPALSPSVNTAPPVASASEPRLRVNNIQGNILAGFNKDQQTLLFLRMPRSASGQPRPDSVRDFRGWLGRLVPYVATTGEVLAFNRLFKEIRRRRRADTGTVQATWVNVALSADALRALTADASVLTRGVRRINAYAAASNDGALLSVDRFADEAFKQGLAARAVEKLNDPAAPDAEGHPTRWVFGGPDNEADAVVIVASDTPEQLAAEVARIEDSLYSGRTAEGVAARCGVQVIHKQQGATLPPPLTGHEHFGFLDGVSQPGVRGFVDAACTDLLTPRQNPANENHGKPGQELIWPGEFVFDYPGQLGEPVLGSDGELDLRPNPNPGAVAGTAADGTEAPIWAKDGSFLVIRRLRQDVDGFHRFLGQTAATLGITPELLGAKVIGRWASGAPLMRAANADNPALAFDDCANNNFDFQKATPPSAAKPPAGACGDTHAPQAAPAPADPSGGLCPHFAHIRKTYPRDDVGTLAPAIGDATTATHRLLRRGIPFGDPFFPPKDPNKVKDAGSRGLVFAAYQTSIEQQFEFVQHSWANNTEFKDKSGSDGEPVVGHDLVIGQTNSTRDGNVSRVRQARLTLEQDGQPVTYTIVAKLDWVIPTGGGYFFAPSIDALRLLTDTE